MTSADAYKSWAAKRNAEIEEQERQKALTVLVQSQKINPDEYAENMKLGRAFGAPMLADHLVAGDALGGFGAGKGLPAAEEIKGAFMDRMNTLKTDTILKGSPTLARWLTQDDNARLAHDDLGNLSGLAGYVRYFGERMDVGVNRGSAAIAQWLADDLARQKEDQGRDFLSILEDETKQWDPRLPRESWWALDNLAGAGFRWAKSRMSSLTGEDLDAGRAYYQGVVGTLTKAANEGRWTEDAGRFNEAFAATKFSSDLLPALSQFGMLAAENPRGFAEWVAGVAAESLPMMALASGATLTAGPVAGAAALGAGSYLQERYSYADTFREAGIDLTTPEGVQAALGRPELFAEAQRRGDLRGAIIGLLDGLSGGVAGKVLVRNRLGNLLAQTLAQGGLGGAGEAIGGAAATGQVDWGAVFVEMAAEMAGAPVEVAAMGGHGITRRLVEANDAVQRRAFFERLGGEAAKSKLRLRMPERFRSFLDQALKDGPVERLLVPGKAFREYFQSAGFEPEEIARELGLRVEDINVAAETGGDVEIPTALWASTLAGSEHDAFMLDNMRLRPGELTVAEAKEVNARIQEIQDEARQAHWEAMQGLREIQSYEREISDEMASRLMNAGQAPEVARQNAGLWGAFYKTMADRSGYTPDELLARFPLPEIASEASLALRPKSVDAFNRTLAEVRGRRKRKSDRSLFGSSLSDLVANVGAKTGANYAAEIAQIMDGQARPGQKRAVRDDGVGVDEIARMAMEGGYLDAFPEAAAWRQAEQDGGQAPDLVPVLLDALAQDRAASGGKFFGTADKAALEAREREDYLDQVEQLLSEAGIDLDAMSDEEIKAAVAGYVQELDGEVRSYSQGLELEAFQEELKAELGLRSLDLFLTKAGDLRVNMIAVPRDQLGKGLGTKAMERIVAFADANGYRITLTAGQKDDGFGTTSHARLVQFYKRFGFVENKGRNKDFAISEGMYRPAKAGRSYSQTDVTGPGLAEVLQLKKRARELLAATDWNLLNARGPKGDELLAAWGEWATAASELGDQRAAAMDPIAAVEFRIQVARSIRQETEDAQTKIDPNARVLFDTFGAAIRDLERMEEGLEAERKALVKARTGEELAGMVGEADAIAAVIAGLEQRLERLRELHAAEGDTDRRRQLAEQAGEWAAKLENAKGLARLFERPGTDPSRLARAVAKPMVVQHMITPDKLQGLLSLGGKLPMPSIAVTQAEMGLARFGQISLLGAPDMLDPEADPANDIYGGDIYSPRHPRVESKWSADGVLATRDGWISQYAIPDGVVGLNSPSWFGAEADPVSELTSDPATLYAYLAAIGKDPAALVVYQPEKITLSSVMPMPADLKRRLEEVREAQVAVGYSRLISIGTMNELRGGGEDGAALQDPELYEEAAFWLSQAQEARVKAERERAIADSRAAMAERGIGPDHPDYAAIVKGAETVANIRENEVRRVKLVDASGRITAEGALALDQAVDHVDGRQIDKFATRDNLEDEATLGTGNREAFETWVRAQLAQHQAAEMELDDGTRVPYSPEAALEDMRGRANPSVRNSESKYTTPQSLVNLRAQLTPRFDNLQAVQDWRDKIESGQTWEDTKRDYERQINEVADIREKVTGRPQAGNVQATIRAIASYAEGDLSDMRFATDFLGIAHKPGDDLTSGELEAKERVDELIEAVRAMPTEYLEAKPDRIVDIREFAAAVMPDGPGLDPIADQLAAKGIQVHRYTPGGDNYRLAILKASRTGRLLFQDQGKTGERGRIEIGAAGLSMGSRITLFESANLSTFLHESGHFFLTMYQELAADPNAAPALAADWTALRAWWADNAADVAKDASRTGVQVTDADVLAALSAGTTGDLAKDRAIDVGMQEQFARGFEQYLMEGKAPSVELRGVFAAFKSWLLAVYHQVRNLRVNMTDEVRGVMSRMLASEEQIQATAQDLGDGLLFKSAAEMGVDPAAYEELVKLHERAREEASTSLLKRFMAPLVRQRRQEWKENRAKVEAEIAAQVNAEPVYRALELMGNRRWFEGTEARPAEGVQMSRRDLVALYGEGVLKTLPRGQFHLYTNAVGEGMHPDEAAEFFGFADADEMIRALENARPRRDEIKARTDAEMVKRYGDVLNDGTAEEAAREAFHNDTRARFLQAELDALFKRMGPKGTPSTLAQTKEVARRAIRAMTARHALETGRFLAAERRAGYDAQKALAAGDLEAAAEAKRRQLLNHQLWIESNRAAQEVERIERLAKRLGKTSVREKLAGSFLPAIDQLLEQYDFRKLSAKAETKRGALLAFVQDMIDQGRENELAIPPEVLAEARRIPYKTLSLERLLGVGDALRNIEHMARLKQKLLDAKAERELDAVVGEIVADYDANIAKRPPRRGAPSAGERLREGLARYANLWLTADTLLNETAGFGEKVGAAYRHIKAPVDAAMSRLQLRRHEAAKALEGLYDVYTAAERGQMARAVMIPELGDKFSKWELIAMALNMGNADNLERLTNPDVKDADGRQLTLTPDQVEAVKGMLDARDWQFVQSVWDYIDGFWPEIEAREKRITGVAPKKVDAQPLETAAGTLRGGYYPIQYDARLAGQVAEQEIADLVDAMKGGRFGKAQTKNGHTKARSSSTKLPLRYDMGVLHQHVGQVLHDLELSEVVSNTWRILQDPRLKGKFLAAGRKDDHTALELWIQDVAAGDVRQGDWVNATARRLRAGFTISKLAFSIQTAMLQATGFAQAAVVVGKKDWTVGFLRYLSNPLIVRDVVARSEFMRQRQTSFQKDIMDLLGDMKAGPEGKAAKARDWMLKAGFWPMMKVQFLLVDVPTWLAAYRKGLRVEGSEEAAAAYADRLVARAATSGLQADRAMIERGTLSRSSRQSDVTRLFTALGSYMFAKMNVAYVRAKETDYRSPVQVLSLAVDMTLLFTVEAVLAALVKGHWPDDDDGDGEDEEWLAFLAAQTGLSIAGGLPFIRDAASVAQGFGGGGAYGGIVETAARPFVEWTDGDLDKRDAKALSDLAGLFLKFPAAQFNRSVIDTAASWDQGRDVGMGELIFGAPPKR